MFRRLAILILLCSVLFHSVLAQEKDVTLSIQFLSNDRIGDINFKVEAFAAHGKKAVDVLELFFADYDKRQEIVILETLYPDKDPTFSIHARPAMLITEMEEVLKKLDKIKAVRGKYVQFHLAYLLDIKGGIADQKAVYVPDIRMPVQLEFEAIEDAVLGGKVELIQQWAREEVLPVLTALQKNADPKFEGVKGFGKALGKIDWNKDVDVLALTEKNPIFWKASIEMNRKNQLIGPSKIFLHVAAGEFDYIKLYLDLLPSFSDPKTISSHYLKELKWRLDIFYAELEAQVNGGVLMHGVKEYLQAVSTYKRILSEYPNSAWTLYERYFSRNAQRVKFMQVEEDDREDWDAAKGTIYRADPLYEIDVRASNKREAYLLFRRAEIGKLFSEEENFNKDFVKLADIALDLEVYGFAAHFYWLALSSVRRTEHGDRELLYYFLYCLDKLGDTELKQHFKGDMGAEFKKISLERERVMKESSIYRSFKKSR